MDDNDKSVIYGVSHLDGITPVAIKFDSSRNMLIDFTTSIAFNPAIYTAGNRYYPLAEATSEVDNHIVKPWVVNATTGAVLATRT